MLTQRFNTQADLNLKQQRCQNVRSHKATADCCERLLLYHNTLDLWEEKQHITDKTYCTYWNIKEFCVTSGCDHV